MRLPVVVEKLPEPGPVKYIAYPAPLMAIGYGDSPELALEALAQNLRRHADTSVPCFASPAHGQLVDLEI